MAIALNLIFIGGDFYYFPVYLYIYCKTEMKGRELFANKNNRKKDAEGGRFQNNCNFRIFYIKVLKRSAVAQVNWTSL